MRRNQVKHQWCVCVCAIFLFAGSQTDPTNLVVIESLNFPKDGRKNSVWKIGAGRSWINSPSSHLSFAYSNVFLIIMLGV